MFDAWGIRSFGKIVQNLGLAGDPSLSMLKDCFEIKLMVVELTL